MPQSAPRPLRQQMAHLDLPKAAVAAALAELVLDRLLPAALPNRLHPALVLAGVFARNLSTALCLLVLGLGLVLTVRRRDLLPAPARALFALVAVVLVPALAWAAAAPVPAWIATELESSFVFFALACLLAGLRRARAKRTKLALVLLVLPIILRGYALAAGSAQALALGRLDARELAENAGEAAALLMGVAAPLVIPPRHQAARLLSGTSIAFALVVTVGAAIASVVDFSAAQAAAGALGFTLPYEPGGRFLYFAALLGATWTAASLIRARGSVGLLGAGFALVTMAGYGLGRPSELAALALGLLLVLWGGVGAESVTGETRRPDRIIDEQAWLAQAKAVAFAMAGECIMVRDDPRQITRISGQKGTRPVVVRVVREAGQDLVEVVLGAPPADGTPALEIDERDGVPTTAPFARRFRVRQHVDPSGELGEGARSALEPLGGETAVWPGQGARWRRSFPAPAPLEQVGAVTDLLGVLLGSA